MMPRVAALVFSVGCTSVAHALQSRHRDHLGCIVDQYDGTQRYEFPGPCMQLPFTNCSKELLPTVLYLGMPHSGSSSLAVQLNMHSQLSYGKVKEHGFFVSAGPQWHTPNNPNVQDGERNASTYKGEFLVDCDTKVTFDGSPYYLYLGDENANCVNKEKHTLGCSHFHYSDPGVDAIKKVREMLGGDLKLVAMFRDPMDMVTSQYPDPTEYADVLEYQKWKTCYAEGLDSWLSVFPRKNFLFLDSEEYFKSPQTTIDRVLDFAGLKPKTYSELELDSFGRRRSGASRRDILPRRLREAYHAVPYNSRCKARLEKITGLTLNWRYSIDHDPKYDDTPEADDKEADALATFHSILDTVAVKADWKKSQPPEEEDEDEDGEMLSPTNENICDGRVLCADAKTIEEMQQCC